MSEMLRVLWPLQLSTEFAGLLLPTYLILVHNLGFAIDDEMQGFWDFTLSDDALRVLVDLHLAANS
jgi:hypothetical protein